MAVATAEVLSILEGGKANLEDLKANEGNKEIARENGVSIMGHRDGPTIAVNWLGRLRLG